MKGGYICLTACQVHDYNDIKIIGFRFGKCLIISNYCLFEIQGLRLSVF